MKKIVLCLVILTLFCAYIAWELASAGDDAGRVLEIRPRVQVTTEELPNEVQDLGPVESGESALIPAVPAPVTQPDQTAANSPRAAVTVSSTQNAALATSSENAFIYVFHRKAILGGEKPTDSEMARMQESIALVTKSLPSSVVVLDADGDSLSGIPHILFAAPQFDLTEAIKDHYNFRRNGEAKDR